MYRQITDMIERVGVSVHFQGLLMHHGHSATAVQLPFATVASLCPRMQPCGKCVPQVSCLLLGSHMILTLVVIEMLDVSLVCVKLPSCSMHVYVQTTSQTISACW